MTRSSDNTNYFKGYFNLPPGIADVGSYQVSGLPFINRGAVAANAGGDTTSLSLQLLSRTIINKDAENDEIRVHLVRPPIMLSQTATISLWMPRTVR